MSIDKIYRAEALFALELAFGFNSIIGYIKPGAQNGCISTTLLICIPEFAISIILSLAKLHI